MSRPLRLDLADAIHHVTARGNARERVYVDHLDRIRWLEILDSTAWRLGWLVLAYCQMGNHYHLVVETPQPNLSRGMRQLNGVYAQCFNRRHGRVGHLSQSRFHATMIERGEHLLAVSAYIPLNPVRAGLCTQPGSWRWSSYRATIGLEPHGPLAVERLLTYFGETRDAARERYRSYVEACVDLEAAYEPGRSVILGSEEFLRAHVQRTAPSREVPRSQWQPLRPSLRALLVPRNDATVVHAHRRYGCTMAEIASHLGVHYATVSRRIRRYERALSECKT